MIKARSLTAALLALALTVPFGATAMAANPGTNTTSTGQTLSIQIDGPADGTRVNVPSGNVTVTGTATIGPLSESGNVMYVVDVSGSTVNPRNQDCNGDGSVNAADNLDDDGLIGTTLDCEVAGVMALNGSLAGSPGAEAGVIIFGSNAAIADVSPAGGQQDFLSPLGADGNANGQADINDVAGSLRPNGIAGLFTAKNVGGGTNFDAALTSIRTAFATKPGENNIAFMLSDGQANLNLAPGGPLALVAAAGIKVNTYSVGGDSTGCDPTDNLRRIADATGGTCTEVTDPSDLSSVLINPATISKVEVSLNGGAPQMASLAGNSYEIPLSGLQGGIWNSIAATVTASDGTTATADIQVYGNRAPSADAGGPYTVDEGSSIMLSGAAADPDGDAVSVTWAPSAHLSSASVANPSFQADDNMAEALTMVVTDPYGMSASAATLVTVLNVAPTADLLAPAMVNEGETFALALTNEFDPSAADTAAGFLHAYNCGAGYAASASCTAVDNDGMTVAGRITDKDGGASDRTATVAIANVAPSLSAIAAPAAPYAVGTTVNASATFTDPGILDTHTATFDWGDGASDAGAVTEAGGNGSVAGSHVYTTPGLYTITLTVTDKDGGTDLATYQYVIVYDPDGGFVTGGGWIDTADGRANVGLNAKYKQNATTPEGQTQFQFQAGDINFHSTSYDWLVVAGARAQYMGSGTVNGSGDYGFMLAMVDGQQPGGGGTDMVRMMIWEKATGTVIYDTQMGDPLTAAPTTPIQGSVVIHD
ncbi:MAG: hypothetical protein K0R39_2723 [Symbiobacteriaceae bacterium]|nr:hypothetical protein [Symbiobacteriaceae bacterium]